MSELSQQLDNMLTRVPLQHNKYLLKHMDQNLCIPIAILQKEYSLAKHSSDELITALKSCKNCKLTTNDTCITLLIKPHTNNIIINEIAIAQSDFKQFLLEHFLKDIDCQILFDGGCCKVIFKDDEIGLKFLEQACNHPTHPLKAYVEPENVYLSLVRDLATGQDLQHGYNEQNAYYQQVYYGNYYYQYDNMMFQNLYIRKASDDQQQPNPTSKPFFPPYPYQPAQRKKSGQEHQHQQQRKHSSELEKKAKNTPQQVVKEAPYVEKASVAPVQQPVQQTTPTVQFVEKQTQDQKSKIQQSPYVEKKQQPSGSSRKTSESLYVQKHPEASCLSPSKKATIQYKKEKLIDIFKQVKAGLKVHPNLLKALDKEPTVLLSNGYITLEHIDPTQRRKDSSQLGTPQQYVKASPVIPQRKASEQQQGKKY